MADESVNAVAVVHVPDANRSVQRPADNVLPVELKTVNAICVTL